MKPTAGKLGLGTAQFGLDYGITNTTGQVTLAEASRILEGAREADIRVLDTAAAYGDSEVVLGRLLRGDDAFAIATKTMPIRASRLGEPELATIRAGFESSLARLGRTSVDTLLVHHADDLLVPGGERLYAQLARWQADGRVARLGVSVYDQRQIDALFGRYAFQVVQLPLNVLDQRLMRAGVLRELARRGVAVHVRSVFLQGLLLASPGQWPDQFAAWRPWAERYHAHLARLGVTPLTAALGFAAAQPGVEAVLVGVVERRQLDECVAAAALPGAPNLDEYACDDLDLVDPRCWT